MPQRPEINKQLVDRVRRIIIEFSSPIIPVTLIFGELGYSNLSGLSWGILVGVIGTISIEFGYEVVKIGTGIFIKKSKDSDSKAVNSEECESLKNKKKV